MTGARLKTLVLGFDAFDPRFFERLYNEGKTPNLARLADGRGYARLEIPNPPQSEVSWTSIATGLNPGQHGMFDFVHRDPATYTPFVSLLPTSRRLGVTTFLRPHNATTIFDLAADRGYPATSLWWPATFPARQASPVRTLPGLGTPDLLGRLGVGSLYTNDGDLPEKLGKTPVLHLTTQRGPGLRSELIGPSQAGRSAGQQLRSSFTLTVDGSDQRGSLEIGDQRIPLQLGQWSPIFEISFRVNRFVSIRAITRAILTQIAPSIRLYFLPIQLHPLAAIWPYGTPGGFVKDTWRACGPFLTLGWPQDTSGLEDGCIDDGQFLALCETIFDARVRILLHHLESFSEGLLASVFDCLDRVQHMFWRQRPDIVEHWYRKLDELVGTVIGAFDVAPESGRRLIIVSDHGCGDVDYRVHLNRWLAERGYLTASPQTGPGEIDAIDWAHTTAYAVGLNSVYLNLAGREASGAVTAEAAGGTCDALKRELTEWRGPDGRSVVKAAWLNREIYHGPHAGNGPDIVVGYTPGYRASSETGLGGWGSASIEANLEHWGGDHCFDAQTVPGVLFANRDLGYLAAPSYRDMPMLAVDAEPSDTPAPSPPTSVDDDAEAIEERLKSLGYL